MVVHKGSSRSIRSFGGLCSQESPPAGCPMMHRRHWERRCCTLCSSGLDTPDMSKISKECLVYPICNLARHCSTAHRNRHKPLCKAFGAEKQLVGDCLRRIKRNVHAECALARCHSPAPFLTFVDALAVAATSRQGRQTLCCEA